MSINYNQMKNAYSEVYEILKITDESLVEKIPQNYLNVIKNNRNLSYKFTYDETKKPNEQKVLKETKDILGFLYLNYWADENEKKIITTTLRKNEIKEQKKKKQEFNSKELFPNKYSAQNNEVNINANKHEQSVLTKGNDENISNITFNKDKQNALIVKEKKNFFRIILDKLSRIFRF